MTNSPSIADTYSPDAALLAAMLREGVEAGQQPRLAVISNSMAPLLQAGDQVEVTRCALASLTAGSIIVVEAQGATLTHRYWRTITHAGQPYLLTRGDRVLSYDAPHAADAIIGRITTRIRAGQPRSLDNGTGRQVNQRLSQLAAFENRILAPRHALDDWQALQSPDQRRLGDKWPSAVTRVLRLFIRSYSKRLVRPLDR